MVQGARFKGQSGVRKKGDDTLYGEKGSVPFLERRIGLNQRFLSI